MTKRKSYIDDNGDAKLLDDQWFKEAKRGVGRPKSSNRKEPVSIRIDPEVLTYFKGKEETGWQTRINDALRKAAGL